LAYLVVIVIHKGPVVTLRKVRPRRAAVMRRGHSPGGHQLVWGSGADSDHARESSRAIKRDVARKAET
jgi:hypothetical protein